MNKKWRFEWKYFWEISGKYFWEISGKYFWEIYGKYMGNIWKLLNYGDLWESDHHLKLASGN